MTKVIKQPLRVDGAVAPKAKRHRKATVRRSLTKRCFTKVRDSLRAALAERFAEVTLRKIEEAKQVVLRFTEDLREAVIIAVNHALKGFKSAKFDVKAGVVSLA